MEIFFHANVILICMVVAAFLSGIETGVISIDRMRLRHFVRKGEKWARTLQSFLDNSDRLFGTTLVGTNLSMVIISVVAASVSVQMAGVAGEIFSTIGLSVLVLVFSEFIPKAWFRSNALEKCRRFAAVLQMFELALRPVYTCVIRISRFIVPDPGRSGSRTQPFVTKDDLMVLAGESVKSGVLTGEESLMIKKVLDLAARTAAQLMVPREKMVYVASDAGIDEFCDLVRRNRFTRIPVLDKAKNQFTGIINVFDVLAMTCEKKDRKLADHIRPPLLISEDTPVEQILPRARRLRQPMCLVARKDGEVIGLVTVTDLLANIVGRTL